MRPGRIGMFAAIAAAWMMAALVATAHGSSLRGSFIFETLPDAEERSAKREAEDEEAYLAYSAQRLDKAAHFTAEEQNRWGDKYTRLHFNRAKIFGARGDWEQASAELLAEREYCLKGGWTLDHASREADYFFPELARLHFDIIRHTGHDPLEGKVPYLVESDGSKIRFARYQDFPNEAAQVVFPITEKQAIARVLTFDLNDPEWHEDGQTFLVGDREDLAGLVHHPARTIFYGEKFTITPPFAQPAIVDINAPASHPDRRELWIGGIVLTLLASALALHRKSAARGKRSPGPHPAALLGLLLLCSGRLSAKSALEIADEQISAPARERELVLQEVTGILEADPRASKSIEEHPDFQNFHDTVMWTAFRRTFFDQTRFAKNYPHLYAYAKVALADGNYSNPVYYQLPGDRYAGQPRALTGDKFSAIRPTVCETVRINKWESPLPEDGNESGSFTFLATRRDIYLIRTSISRQTHGAKSVRHRLLWYRIDGRRLIPDRFETYLVPAGKETEAGRLISTAYPIEPAPPPSPLLDSAGNPPSAVGDALSSTAAYTTDSLNYWNARGLVSGLIKMGSDSPDVLREALSILEKHPEIVARLDEKCRLQNVTDQILWAAAREVSFDQNAFIRTLPYLSNYGEVLLVSSEYYGTPRIIYQNPNLMGGFEPRMLYGNSDSPMAATIGTASGWDGEQRLADQDGNYSFEKTPDGLRLCRTRIGRIRSRAVEARHILYWMRVENAQLIPDHCEAYLVPPGHLRSEQYLTGVSTPTNIAWDDRLPQGWPVADKISVSSQLAPPAPLALAPAIDHEAAALLLPHPPIHHHRSSWDYVAWTALGAGGALLAFATVRGSENQK